MRKLFQKHKTVSVNPHFAISSVNPSENTPSPARLPNYSLDECDEETKPDPKLPDNVRTPFGANLLPALSSEISQKTTTEPKNQIKRPQKAINRPTTSPLDVT